MSAAAVTPPDELVAARARRRSALFSVVAACFLVALKLGTGLVTGSIAFLAEAAHSATDLVAALLTLFAVRVALRPPDREHNYGHGKAEHLAALAESAFLLVVALAIGSESRPPPAHATPATASRRPGGRSWCSRSSSPST